MHPKTAKPSTTAVKIGAAWIATPTAVRTTRTRNVVTALIPIGINRNPGPGSQVACQSLDHRGRPSLLVTNKHLRSGIHHTQPARLRRMLAQPPWTRPQPLPPPSLQLRHRHLPLRRPRTRRRLHRRSHLAANRPDWATWGLTGSRHIRACCQRHWQYCLRRCQSHWRSRKGCRTALTGR